MAALNPLTLSFTHLLTETEFCVLHKRSFTRLGLPLVIALAALSVARIVAYGKSSTGESEVAWASAILGLCFLLSCALCKQNLKVSAMCASMVLLYLTAVEWATSYEDFFCWQVRGLWVLLAIASVYAGTLIFIVNWPAFAGITVFGGLYAILRTYFKFERSDLFALLLLATVPAAIGYWKTKHERLMYLHIAGLKEVSCS